MIVTVWSSELNSPIDPKVKNMFMANVFFAFLCAAFLGYKLAMEINNLLTKLEEQSLST